MSRLSRKEMKRDEVREVLARTLVWLSDHATQILVGFGAVALLVVAVTFFANRSGGRQDAASDALSEAISAQSAPLASEISPGVAAPGDVFASAAERTAEARRRFETVTADFPRSDSARIARAYLAIFDYEAGASDAARAAWDELAASGSDDLLTAQVMLNLLAIDREQGNEADAESRLLSLVDSKTSPLPQDRVLYELGVTQEALGKVEESRATFERLIEEHPTSALARSATVKLAAFGVA